MLVAIQNSGLHLFMLSVIGESGSIFGIIYIRTVTGRSHAFCGDFNTILRASEELGGLNPDFRSIQDFQSVLP